MTFLGGIHSYLYFFYDSYIKAFTFSFIKKTSKFRTLRMIMQVLIICMIGPHKNDSTLTGFMPNGQYGSVFSQLKGIIIMGAYDFFLKQTANVSPRFATMRWTIIFSTYIYPCSRGVECGHRFSSPYRTNEVTERRQVPMAARVRRGTTPASCHALETSRE